MKKKIIIGLALLCIIATAVIFGVMAFNSYNYNIQNKVDIFTGFGSFIYILIGGFIVWYEIDLFFTIYYFAIGPKTKIKTVLNLLSNPFFLLTFIAAGIPYLAANLNIFGTISIVLFILYLILRIIYIMIPSEKSKQQ